ncbi:GntR family transcriptional regulator [Nocardia bovistercoris]|uniref:GntR family transcriptional regulator n=1 Tax=Nocardia bovistercoris TaxID=2785916 RepID=A0A931N5Y4_9NOCA|nr:GntR family transcriptional regulator [Nocardia bovistercoris]
MSNQPRYAQIVADLRARIERGEYKTGDQIPTKAELMDQWGVALNTVARAVTELQQAGLIETHHGVGSFVRTPPTPTPTLDEEVATLRGRVTALEGHLTALYEHLGIPQPSEATP